ncbi:mannosyltransferase [Rhizina undulata]
MRPQTIFFTLVGLFSVVSARIPLKQLHKPQTKYFHEPGRSETLSHYDIRYYKKIVDYDTRLDSLQHLIRSWLQTTSKEGIETWIAHGTLLGWWWNGKLLPWDWDLDVQVSLETLNVMALKYNMTRHQYTSEEGSVKREYLLDVNPNLVERTRGDAQNVIDARWIDVEDIWPLRDTILEGVPAKVPYNFEEILIKEYRAKALVITEWEGHRWNTRTKIWDRNSGVPKGAEGKIIAIRSLLKEPQYSTDESGGFFHNLFRLVHWW